MLPKQSAIEIPLLRVLNELGGKASPAEIYPHLQNLFPDISEQDLEATLPSGANTWRNRVAWARQKLILQGELSSVSRGSWAITSLGIKRLNSPTEYVAAIRGGEIPKQLVIQASFAISFIFLRKRERRSVEFLPFRSSSRYATKSLFKAL